MYTVDYLHLKTKALKPKKKRVKIRKIFFHGPSNENLAKICKEF